MNARPAAEPAQARWRRLWPGGITSRVALILMIGLLVLQAISIAVYMRDRAQVAIRVFAESIAARIVAIVELIEATPADQRSALLPALNSPTLWVTLADRAPTWRGDRWHRHDRIERRVRRHLQSLGARRIEVRVLGGWRRPWDSFADVGGPPVPDLLPSRRKLAISIGMTNGEWLVFAVASDIASLRWAARMLFWLSLTGMFILAFAVWAARRVTKPLTRFAEAADRLGVDVGGPPLSVTGSGELKKAADAFNRMQERIRRLVDDRTQMLAAISHDLRTMLTRLRLRAEFIEDAEQQEKAVADLDAMATMLDETLAFARDDSAGEPRTKVDLAGLVQSLSADAGAAVTYTGPSELAYWCRPVALKRAVANLIDNAMKYGESADVTLSAGVETIDLTVADRGPGIPVEERERVFAPFHRLEPSRSRETGGTGLGLAVARTIIHRHGGEIVLEDRPGGGLLVRVTLPRAVA